MHKWEGKTFSESMYLRNRISALDFTKLTISVQLIWVENQSTVIFIIRDAIIVIIIITSIPNSIFVIVLLPRVGKARAVVLKD